MQGDPRKDDKIKSENDFDFWRYLSWRKKRGIYVPETKECECQAECCHTTVQIQSRIPIDPKRDKIIAVATIIGTIISALTLYVVIRYTEAAFKQVTQTQIANALAETSSRESGLAAKLANDTFIASERPWIGTVIGWKDLEIDKLPVISISFLNSGKRPAKVTFSVVGHHLYKTLPPSPEFPKETGFHSVALVVPGGSLRHDEALGIFSKGYVAEMVKSGETVFIYSKIVYEDVVTHETHWTHSCWQVAPDSVGTWSLINCASYNEAD
jgi:hypothetical protein